MRQAVDPAGTEPITRSARASVFGAILGGVGRAMRARATVTILCLAAILPVGAIPGGFFDTSRNWLFDFYQRAAPALRVAPQTVIIDIDSASLERIGQWPWPRDQLARLVDAASGARVVGIDILLAEPDRLSPAAWAAARPDVAPETRRALTALPSNDALLAPSIARVPVVLATVAAPATNRNAASAMPMIAVIEAGSDPRPALPQFAGFTPPLPELAAAARAVGMTSVPVEMDGVLRRMPAITKIGSALIPAFAIELASLASGAGHVTLENGSAGLWIDLGDKAIHIDPQGRVWERYAEPMPATSVPAYRVLEGRVDAALFHDRIVLIGTSAPGLGDLVATPLRHAEPGVAVQAQLIETLLAGDALWRPPATQELELVLAFGLGVFAVLLLGRLPDTVYAALLAGVAVLMVAGSFAAFRTTGLLIDWTFPAAILAAAALCGLAARVRREARARRGREAERQRALELLRRSQRLEMVGNLAGGIAHDFNNLLGVIILNAEALLDSIGDRPEAAEQAQDILHNALSGAELTHRLSAFTRQQPLKPQRIDLNVLLANQVAMLRRMLGKTIEVAATLAPGLWLTNADPSRIGDALLNLALNARDAMPDGGRLIIETANAHLDGPAAALHIEATPGDYVVLAVTDTGIGMAPEVAERATEPFFSTKPPGSGSGLGLSMIDGFARQSGGHLAIKSEVGVGTTVRLYLPRAQEGAATGPDAPDATAPDLGGHEAILVVDDNRALRDVAQRNLSALGYKVVCAESGPAALELLRSGEKFDLLFTDVVMPFGMSGYELAEAARRLQPGLRVLFTTGYAEAIATSGHEDQAARHMLRKPYRRKELAEKIRALLGTP
jgi:signal transduction histidine kinase